MKTQPYTRNVLIVDDEHNLRDSLAEYLALEKFICSGAEDGKKAFSLLEDTIFDAVVLDLRLPEIDGLAVLTTIKDRFPSLPVIMISAHGDIQDAVEAMKLGAVDYLVKPFDPAELAIRLEKAITGSRLIHMAQVGRRLAEFSDSDRIWRGASISMKEVYRIVDKVSPMPSTVLITGESGTGKEVIARDIHRLSPRSEGPFIPVNVGAIPESLLESELFGYEKGAFTGATARKSGLFELASGGTLFLDELGEMPASMQVKLLRVLQERVILRVGGTRPFPVDIRIVTATNKDLMAAVREGSFREDLFFRINVIQIQLPPLRERKADIAHLAGFFISRFSKEMGKPINGITPTALSLLSSYSFPGNIRELENSIERAVILADGHSLDASDFFFPETKFETQEFEKENPSLKIRDVERQTIMNALERNNGHRERTAGELGISRRTLLNKIKEYSLH